MASTTKDYQPKQLGPKCCQLLDKARLNLSNLAKYLNPPKAGPGCSGLQVKQMQSYYYGCTHSGGTVRGLDRGDLQQHNAPLSYKRSVATIHCKKQTGDVTRRKPLSLPLQHTYLEVVGSNPKTGKNFLGTKFNCSHEWMMLKLTSLSHFLQIQLAQSYLESSFLLFLLPLESISKLLTLTF